MKMVERANRALTSLYFDCLTTMQNDKKALGISGATGISIGVIASSLSVALATEGGDETILASALRLQRCVQRFIPRCLVLSQS